MHLPFSAVFCGAFTLARPTLAVPVLCTREGAGGGHGGGGALAARVLLELLYVTRGGMEEAEAHFSLPSSSDAHGYLGQGAASDLPLLPRSFGKQQPAIATTTEQN